MMIVNQSPGWMCVRHAPPGIPPPAEEIIPQLRPDNDVRTGGKAIAHHHPTTPSDGPVMNPFVYKDGGVEERHATACNSRTVEGGACDCQPKYRAWARTDIEAKRSAEDILDLEGRRGVAA